MKRKRNDSLNSSDDFDLPDDCWRSVFRFLNDDDDNHKQRYMESLSVASKHFLSVTNRHKFSLTISDQTLPSLPRLFQRFTNLTSLDFKRFCGDLDTLLCQISSFPLNLTSLNLSNHPIIPQNGLRFFSQNITTLTSLNCSCMDCIDSTDLFLIADCFPLLEELDLSNPIDTNDCTKFLDGVESRSLGFSKLRKVNLSGNYYLSDKMIFYLFKNCKILEEVIMFKCDKITTTGIASALYERPTLKSLSFTDYFKWDNCATLIALVRICPLISEISVKHTCIGKKSVANSNSNSLMDLVVSPQLKSLRFTHSSWLRDENIKMFASIFPNLHLLDLSDCSGISNQGIYHVLRRCCDIRHLYLADCSKVNLHRMIFDVPKLEVLELSYTRVDDKTLYAIAKSCRGLLQLLLQNCCDVTEKGVEHVVENCTQLREINLRNCHKVDANVVTSMITSRPLLRKIIVMS